MKLWIKILSLCLCLGVTACQSKIDTPQSVCLVSFEVSKTLSRLNDEGDHLLWVDGKTGAQVETTGYQVSGTYFDGYFDGFYEGWKSALSGRGILVKEPSDFLDDGPVNYPNIFEKTIPGHVYRPVKYQFLKPFNLKDLSALGKDNQCDLVAKIHLQWVQSPNFEFLNKPTYHLGLLSTVDVLQVKDKRSASYRWLETVKDGLAKQDLNRSLENLLASEAYDATLSSFQRQVIENLPVLIQTIGKK